MSVAKNQSFVRRLRFALHGLRHALRTEHSVRIQFAALLGAVSILIVARPEVVWWALVGLACAAVIGAELMNTAIEHLADQVQPEMHPSIRAVKDCAAAAVLVASLGAVGVGIALVIHLATRGP